MNHHSLLVLAVGCVVLGCTAVQPVMADQASGSAEMTGTTTLGPTAADQAPELPAGTQDSHGGEESHEEGDSHDESSGTPGLVHLSIEVLQILFAVGAVVSVVLAGRVYGGEVGRALLVSGVGVTLFALQRLWHNFHELGFVGSPTALGEQGLFILAAGALAVGYLSLYQTMDKRMG